MKKKILFILAIIYLGLLTTNVIARDCGEPYEIKPISWIVESASVSPSEVSAGGTVLITVPIKNDAQNTEFTCTITAEGKSDTKQISPQTRQELTLQITAPDYETSSQKTETVNIDVKGSGHWDRGLFYCDYKVEGQTTKLITYKWPTQTEISEKLEENQAESAKTAASNAIGSANAAISNADNRINDASNIGADVNQATSDINSAKSYRDQAEDSFTSGKNALNNNDYSSAISFYNSAKSKAESSQDKAANAFTMVDKIIEEYNKEETEAQNKVSDVNSAIDTAKQRIDAGDKVISEATIIGLDTAQAKADIATARSKIDTAEDYYKEASNLFSSKNFEGAKSKAQSGINLADDAERLATTAYNRLQERLTVSGESSKAILNANSEISQMNEILTKIDYIIRNVEKQGVDLTSTKSVVANAKNSVDGAEDVFSKAQNRQASGQFTEATNFGNQARDSAASARNRLDTITQTFSVNVQNSLEKAYEKIKLVISAAEEEVKSAETTYGASAEDIVNAQNKLKLATSALKKVETQIQKVKVASGLMDLVKEADLAFKELYNVEKNALDSVSFSKAAKRALLEKIAAIGAGVIAVGGGGFLYYRQRKKKKKKEGKEKKVDKKDVKKLIKPIKEFLSVKASKKEIEKKLEAKGWDKETIDEAYEQAKEKFKEKEKEEKKEKKKKKECPKCGYKIKKEKFCPACGKKIGE